VTDKKDIGRFEKIILGIDPGTNIMGYGVIGIKGKEIQYIAGDIIDLRKIKSQGEKLAEILISCQAIVRKFLPDEMALEAPFFGKNIQSMLKLGRAQGVAMASAIQHQIPIFEYAPRKIKQSITGNGNASKEQLENMVMSLLKLKSRPKFLDSSDALGVAICHHFQSNVLLQNTGAKSWSSFLKNNPKRLIP
jgi:crossover junction endodeoxyribonuclease RuvC|tara:strand:+ start:11786 stop:12361 length:576 start_codon:yes stop_codon:yes gene_type:complete